ncbi:hypothetical protein B1756_13685 [Natrarchaeobaculum aegyptiacum]|uniref:Halobacterial output domain-containing protein n=2 Tax=Natrarchaeobaculum aegyptiacum TaxID=745377 RepID=A0A2Z2I1S6_9EURY|nr:hypothetical protein B1756_13685 [Natrarchaeobaculum aegyptiacum]
MTRSSPTDPDAPPKSVTATVVEAVATHKNVDPVALEPPLHDVIDTDALETLFAPTRRGPRSGSVTFVYDDLQVTVDADGTVDVEELE